MKTAIFLFCVVCTTGSFGQNVVGGSAAQSTISSQPQPIQMVSHPEHATLQPLAAEQNLLGNSTYSYARGERPLWEVAPVKIVAPLGDTARNLRKEHAVAKKATKVFED